MIRCIPPPTNTCFSSGQQASTIFGTWRNHMRSIDTRPTPVLGNRLSEIDRYRGGLGLRGAGGGLIEPPGGRGDVRAATQSRAAQLAHGASRLHVAAPLGARPDQHVEHQEHEAQVRGGDRRNVSERGTRGHAAGRGRVHVRGRRLGRRLQDRRALGHPRPHVVEDGSRPATAMAAIAASRCGATS